MDYFDFEEASHAIPSFDLNDCSTSFFESEDFLTELNTVDQDAMQSGNVNRPVDQSTTVMIKLINNKEVEAIPVDADINRDYPMYRAKTPCEVCARMGLDCFLARRGKLVFGCTCCISLYKECSFTYDQMPKGFIATFPGISEDAQVDEGTLKERRPGMRSFDEAKGRKAGARFPRDAVKILKQWLHEHTEHPYPNEREKDELKQLTGLKRSQISNWLANARRRGKVRLPSDPSSPMLGAIDIPVSCKEQVSEMNPLDRWKVSPPEHEPALMTDIARAITTDSFTIHNSSSSSVQNSRASSRKASSEEDSNFSMFRAPSVSSFETRESSDSAFSFASSRSQRSKASLASSQDRRRRRRAPLTTKTTIQSPNKSRGARIFQCTFCTESFPAKYDWQRHEKSLHLALERWICCPDGGTVQTVPGQRKCAFCHELNPSKEHLEIHNFTACHEKTMQERTFYRKDHLRQHLKLVHETKFSPSMEAWKSTTTEIKSCCGFCPTRFTTWQQRADHLAAHFRNGADISTWSRGWGFEPHIEKLVENAIPPYLIGHERNTPNPFIARALPASAEPTPGLTSSTCGEDCERPDVDQYTRDSNCWGRGEAGLIKYVTEQKALGIIPTDLQLQEQSRILVYDDPDPWNWTFAENQIWLDAFKYQMGIGPAPEDVQLRATADVPILPPYAIRGGGKTKKTSPGVNGQDNSMLPPAVPYQPNEFDRVVMSQPDTGMDLDFDAVDLSALDLADFGDMDLGVVNASVDLGPQYATCHVSLDGRSNVQQASLEAMTEHDLNQLSTYVAGFQ